MSAVAELGIRKPESWVLKHLLTLGSTAAGVVAGESPYQTPAQLYDTMVAAVDGRLLPAAINDDMRRGLLTEPLHRQLLADELGVEVLDHDQDTFLYHDAMPWAHSLPDGWLLTVDDVAIPVQLKCPRVRAWHEIRMKGIHGHWLLGSQHTLAVTGAPYEQFSVLNPETMRLITFPVYRDDELIPNLIKIEREFYTRFIARERPPEHTGAVIELPEPEGDYIQLSTPDAEHAASAYREAVEIMKEAEALKTAARDRIAELVGPVRVADLPGLRVHQVSSQGRMTIDKDAMKRDGIDPRKYEKRGNPFTTFRAYNL